VPLLGCPASLSNDGSMFIKLKRADEGLRQVRMLMALFPNGGDQRGILGLRTLTCHDRVPVGPLLELVGVPLAFEI
jgi:hypothetical protein